MKVPAGIAAVVISVRSRNRDPLDEAYRTATLVLGVTVSRASASVSPDGLYTDGQVSCEFLLYRDGSFPRAAETDRTPLIALEDWAHWHYALVALDITPPWTREEIADFGGWLAAMVEEAELGYCAVAGATLLSALGTGQGVEGVGLKKKPQPNRWITPMGLCPGAWRP